MTGVQTCALPIFNIRIGTTLVWRNYDTASHQITSGRVTDNNPGSLFQSGIIGPGDKFQFTFNNVGTFDYFDSLHPWMTGKIIVVNNPPGPLVSIVPGSSSPGNPCVAANNCYSPNTVSITPGTTVTWQNNDSFSECVTSGKVTDSNPGSLFDSGLIGPGNKFQVTFGNYGTYDYFCEIHPWMTGKIIVE